MSWDSSARIVMVTRSRRVMLALAIFFASVDASNATGSDSFHPAVQTLISRASRGILDGNVGIVSMNQNGDFNFILPGQENTAGVQTKKSPYKSPLVIVRELAGLQAAELNTSESDAANSRLILTATDSDGNTFSPTKKFKTPGGYVAPKTNSVGNNYPITDPVSVIAGMSRVIPNSAEGDTAALAKAASNSTKCTVGDGSFCNWAAQQYDKLKAADSQVVITQGGVSPVAQIVSMGAQNRKARNSRRNPASVTADSLASGDEHAIVASLPISTGTDGAPTNGQGGLPYVFPVAEPAAPTDVDNSKELVKAFDESDDVPPAGADPETDVRVEKIIRSFAPQRGRTPAAAAVATDIRDDAQWVITGGDKNWVWGRNTKNGVLFRYPRHPAAAFDNMYVVNDGQTDVPGMKRGVIYTMKRCGCTGNIKGATEGVLDNHDVDLDLQNMMNTHFNTKQYTVHKDPLNFALNSQ